MFILAFDEPTLRKNVLMIGTSSSFLRNQEKFNDNARFGHTLTTDENVEAVNQIPIENR